MPMSFGLTVFDKKGRLQAKKKRKRSLRSIRREIHKGITLKSAFFEVRPFGKRVKYPWENGKKEPIDIAAEGFFKFAMRPFYLSSEYPSYKRPTKAAIRKWKRKQKLEKAPAIGDYLWKHGGAGAKRTALLGGAAAFVFAPFPPLAAMGGFLGGLGIHALRHPEIIKEYRKMMWKKYRVRKKHVWQY